jgi:hypothetical protein
LALDLKRRRSTVSQAPSGGPAPRFSAESEANDGDFEKHPYSFDNVSGAPIREHAEPVLPPASPDIEGEQLDQYQPYGPGDQHSEYDPNSTPDDDDDLTSPQFEYPWIGEEYIDETGSPYRLPPTLGTLHITDARSRTTSSTSTQHCRQSWPMGDSGRR